MIQAVMIRVVQAFMTMIVGHEWFHRFFFLMKGQFQVLFSSRQDSHEQFLAAHQNGAIMLGVFLPLSPIQIPMGPISVTLLGFFDGIY